MAEIDRLPYGLLDEILASRSYGRAYEANRVDTDPERRQSTPMRMLANEIEFELAQEEIETQGDGG